jgi:hypothetical protein
VALLEKDRIRHGEIFVRTAKHGKPVKLAGASRPSTALEALPLPRGADVPECRWFFWSGHGTTHAMVRDATRTMAGVFRQSGVPGACSHRFRYYATSRTMPP